MTEIKKMVATKATSNTEETKKTKLTYEELNNIASQLSQQNSKYRNELAKLSNSLQQSERQAGYAELNFRFMVLDKAALFPKEFVDRIKQEVMEFMTYQEPTTSEVEGNKEDK